MCLTDLANPQYKVVSAQGFEPRTHALEGRCSIQLSYAPTFFTQSGADEGSRTPTPKALDPKSSASANSATSAYFFVGGGWWIRTTESTANRFTVCPLWPLGKSSVYINGAGNRTRTYNLLITSQLLYQLSHTSILLKKYLWRPGRGSNPRPPA